MIQSVMSREQSVKLRDSAKLCSELAKEYKTLFNPAPMKTIVYLEESARMLRQARYWALRVAATQIR